MSRRMLTSAKVGLLLAAMATVIILAGCGSDSDPDSEKSIASRGTLPSGKPNGSVWPDRPPILGTTNFADADVWVALYDVDRGGDQVGMEVWVMAEIDIQPYSLAVWVDGMQFSNDVPLYDGQGAQKLGGAKRRSHSMVESVIAGTDIWGRQKQCIKHSDSDADRSIFGCR